MQHWKSGGHQKWCLTPEERSVQQSKAVKYEDLETAALFGDEASCPVCLEPIVPAKTDLNVTLPCLHVFHISCVDNLRSYSPQQACPLCRTELPSQSDASVANRCCANCSIDKCPNGTPLTNCSNCKVVFYCGRDCQRTHWKHGGHKAICARLTTERIVDKINKPIDILGMTQLINAVRSNAINKVQQLLDQGAAVNQAMTDNGATPLYIAAEQGHTKVASLLIGGGAAVNQARTDDGCTPLYCASWQGHTEVVRVLIGTGAAVNQATTDDCVTPLYIAAQEGHTKVVRLLISSGAAVNQAKTDDGATPLFIASQKGQTKTVAFLVELGANINQCMITAGWSPLFVAAWSGHTEVVRILLAAGADKMVATTVEHLDVEADCTPLAIAVRLGHSEVSGLLLV